MIIRKIRTQNPLREQCQNKLLLSNKVKEQYKPFKK